MHQYTLEDLSNPQTYQNDPDLAKLAKDCAMDNFATLGAGKVSRGELKQQFLQGHFPELVQSAIQRKLEIETAKTEADRQKEHSKQKGASALPSLRLPKGYRASQIYSKTLLSNAAMVAGPWEQSLGEAIKRIGGHWDGQNGENLKAFVIPLENAPKLQGIFDRWVKRMNQQAQQAQEAEAQAQAEQERLRAERISQSRSTPSSTPPGKKTDRKTEKTPTQPRILFPLEIGPPLNQPVLWRGESLVFTGQGKSFTISDEHPSMHGHHLLGYEGSACAYFYYEPTDQQPELELIGEVWRSCRTKAPTSSTPAITLPAITLDDPADL